MLEALGQLAILHMLKASPEGVEGEVDPSKVFFISCDGVRCSRVCKPGDTLQMEVKPKRIKHPMATYTGTLTVSGEKAAFAEAFSLSFDYQQAETQTPAAED
jgi:3-hydroxyacyl-[acyl-carrier-protein] dehydratase